MEDRFRFRAWDSRLQVYAYDVQGISIYDRDEDFITFFRYVEKGKTAVTLEQCTGLKDKNGKLIYEGDIVQYKDYYKGFLVGTFQNKVDFNHGSFFPLCEGSIEDVQVIGNIHENPELLE